MDRITAVLTKLNTAFAKPTPVHEDSKIIETHPCSIIAMDILRDGTAVTPAVRHKGRRK